MFPDTRHESSLIFYISTLILKLLYLKGIVAMFPDHGQGCNTTGIYRVHLAGADLVTDDCMEIEINRPLRTASDNSFPLALTLTLILILTLILTLTGTRW